MTIKKYEAATENEAIMKAKEELGNGAVVMSIKTIKPRGIFRLFRKTVVEVMAAVDDKKEADTAAGFDEKEDSTQKATKLIQEALLKQQEERPESAIEQKLDLLADMLKNRPEVEPEKEMQQEESIKKDTTQRICQLLKSQLLKNEVEEKFADILLEDVERMPDKEEALDAMIANVYQRIVLKLGQPQEIAIAKDIKPRVCFFIGSTGVGKTTTIAKIASLFKLEKNANVALITSDTYRIAAVEQLKTYANILSIPIRVVYGPDEMQEALQDYKGYDLILVDTAGRSPKNEEQCDELQDLLNSVDAEYKEVYLVVSATTKYKDLKKILNRYQDMADYRLIFTKLDETACYGNILNVKMETEAPLSYITCGQVVPDDIEVLNAQAIAKQLLGGC